MRISKSIHYCHLLLGLFQHAQRCNPSCIIQEQLTVSVYQITIDEKITQTKSICVLRSTLKTLGVISKESAELSFFWEVWEHILEAKRSQVGDKTTALHLMTLSVVDVTIVTFVRQKTRWGADYFCAQLRDSSFKLNKYVVLVYNKKGSLKKRDIVLYFNIYTHHSHTV